MALNWLACIRFFLVNLSISYCMEKMAFSRYKYPENFNQVACARFIYIATVLSLVHQCLLLGGCLVILALKYSGNFILPESGTCFYTNTMGIRSR